MLSWVSDSIQKSQQQKPPAWYENEIRFGLCDRQQKDNKRATSTSRRNTSGKGIMPKLRRAFEVATNNTSNGSFPVHEVSPHQAQEETAFEACDSISHCSLSQASESCATSLSYNMSRIDEDDGTNASLNYEMSFVDSMPSPCNSDADSLFGTSLRDMALVDTTNGKDGDDIWLLPTKNREPTEFAERSQPSPSHELKSPTGSILSRVPVLMLPGIDRQSIRRDNLQHRHVGMAWGEGDDGEEEIEFDDNSFLIESKEDQLSSPTRDYDENRNHGNIITRMAFGRRSANMIRKNLKGMMWNNGGIDIKKRGKGTRIRSTSHDTKSPGRKKKRLSTRMHLHAQDPLKELSKCHEKLSQNQRPFTPTKALDSIRDWKRQDTNSASGEKDKFVFDTLASRDSDVSSPSSIPSSPTTQNPLGDTMSVHSTNSDGEQQLERAEENSNLSIPPAAPIQEWELTNTTAAPATSTFKIKFRSPRNDTPRIVLGDQNDTEATEEPRVLYSSEGTVEAIIHPTKEQEPQETQHDGSHLYPTKEQEPQGTQHDGSHCYRGFFPRVDSKNSLNHVFHSELSTLYEVSSSLESASFGTHSGSAGSEESNSRNVPPESGNHPLLRTMSSSTSDSISKHTGVSKYQANGKDSASTKSKSCYSPSSQFDGTVDTRSTSSVSGVTVDRFFVDNCEVKMRWEYSLGVAENGADQWRQPVMGLMNTEELSSDYIAEI